MRRGIASLIIALSVGFAGSVMARDIEDGKLLVYPQKDGQYKVTNTIGDKVTFYGMVGDIWERKHITGLLLKDGQKATDEQKHIVYVTARQLKIDAFVEIDGKEQPIVEAPPPAPAAPVTPATPADAAAPAAPAQPAAPAPPPEPVDPSKH